MRTTHRSRPSVPRSIAAMVAALATGLATAAVPSTAAAHPHAAKSVTMSGTATDEDDVAGRFDIARVRDRVVQVDDARSLLTYRVNTYAAFDSQRLAGPYRKFHLELDRDGVRGAERTVLIESRSGVLRAVVLSTQSGRVIATLPASRPNDHAIAVSGPRRTLGARNYLWSSYFHADRSRRCGWDGDVPRVCQDDAPDEGWLRLQRLAWPGPR